MILMIFRLILVLLIIPIHEFLHIITCKFLKVSIESYSMSFFNPYVKYVTANHYKRVVISIVPSICQLVIGVVLVKYSSLVIVGYLYISSLTTLLPFCKDGNVAIKSIILIFSNWLSKNQ